MTLTSFVGSEMALAILELDFAYREVTVVSGLPTVLTVEWSRAVRTTNGRRPCDEPSLPFRFASCPASLLVTSG